MIVETFTGSTYDINNALLTVARVTYTHDLRRDGETLRLLQPVDVHLGQPMVMLLEPLGEGDCTVRLTSTVTCVIGRNDNNKKEGT